MLQKPPHGKPCNSCGLCCMDQLCPLARHIFGETPGPCPALEPARPGYTCGLVAAPSSYAPAIAREHGELKSSETAALIIGAGLGCDASAPGEIRDEIWLASVKLHFLQMLLRIEDALRLWGIKANRPNRTTSDARTVPSTPTNQHSENKG